VKRKTAYKVLDTVMTSPFKKFKYEIGYEYHCEDFDEDKNKDCGRGLYATNIDGLLYSFNIYRRVFLCEVWGKAVEIGRYKRRYEYLRLIEEVPHSEIKRLATLKEPEVGFKLAEALFPVNPLLLPKNKPNKKDIENMKRWVGVWYRAWNSVADSVKDNMGVDTWDSVGRNFYCNMRCGEYGGAWGGLLRRDSVWDGVRAYISSLFPNIKKWKYINHEEGKNPFQPCIDLWHRGFVLSYSPTYDGYRWRLHSGKNADIVYERKP